MKIYYGIENALIDVTDICLSNFTNSNVITIPPDDGIRASYFTDPVAGCQKIIKIDNDDIVTYYDAFTQIKIDTLTNTITTTNSSYFDSRLSNLHSKLKINYGTFNEELPEQKMVARYLVGNEKVLEIGGNIGRNTLIIASILENSENLVTLESDVNIANQLTINRDLNNFKFHVEASALSKRKLIQKDWNTFPSDFLEDGYTWVNTITFNDLKKKYNLDFDTLVLDCEGAFYYILIDMPEILDNINLIIVENDYFEISQKGYVDRILLQNNFHIDYMEQGGWGPCYDSFFEVWRKIPK